MQVFCVYLLFRTLNHQIIYERVYCIAKLKTIQTYDRVYSILRDREARMIKSKPQSLDFGKSDQERVN